jgi:hypothetical protein
MNEEKEKISPTNADFDKLLKEVLESDDQIIEEEQDIEETDEFDDSLLKEENKTNLELTDEEDTESYLEDEDISIDE